MPHDVVPSGHAPEDGAEPQWLNAVEGTAWVGIVSVITQLQSALNTQLERDAGVNHLEYFVLSALSQNPGHTMGIGQLTGLMGASQSRISHLVKRLEGRGLVRREMDPDDARCTNAILTAAGHDTVKAAAPKHVALVRALVIDALPADLLAQYAVANEIILTRLASRSGFSGPFPTPSGPGPRARRKP